MSASQLGRNNNRAPNSLRTGLAIGLKDLNLEAHRQGSLLPALLFTLVSRILFDFALPGRIAEPSVFAGLLWLLVGFSVVIGIGDSFRSELRHETLQALLATPVDRSGIYLGKLLANWTRIVLLQSVALLTLVASVAQSQAADYLALAASVLLFGLGLAILGTLFAAVSARLQRGETLLALLLLPTAAPLFIGAMQTTTGALEGAMPFTDRWWLLGVGLVALYFFLSLATFEIVVED